MTLNLLNCTWIIMPAKTDKTSHCYHHDNAFWRDTQVSIRPWCYMAKQTSLHINMIMMMLPDKTDQSSHCHDATWQDGQTFTLPWSWWYLTRHIFSHCRDSIDATWQNRQVFTPAYHNWQNRQVFPQSWSWWCYLTRQTFLHIAMIIMMLPDNKNNKFSHCHDHDDVT